MTDYKNLKLIASSSPHIRSNEDTRSIMLDVIIALLPALAWSVYCFGWKALLLTAVSVVSCVFFEWAYRKAMKKSCMVGDLSAVVTGILLSFVCPVDLPWWVIIIGAFFSIVVVKQLYGGIGCNFLNPALAGRAFLLASYATWMTTWAIPQIRPDVTSAATPMAIMKEGTEEAFTTLMSNYSIGDMFLGKVGGSLGEVSALCLLVGGVYLLIRKVISWQIPVAYIGTVAILTLIAAPAGIDNVQYMLYNVFGGGLMLGAIFMATDYATSPVTKPGQLIFGLGCGLLTCFIRRFGSYPEGRRQQPLGVATQRGGLFPELVHGTPGRSPVQRQHILGIGLGQVVVRGVAAQVFERPVEHRPVHAVAVFRSLDQEVRRIDRPPFRTRRVAAPVGECAVGELVAAQARKHALDVAVDVLQHVRVALHDRRQVELREGARGDLLDAAVGIPHQVFEAPRKV